MNVVQLWIQVWQTSPLHSGAQLLKFVPAHDTFLKTKPDHRQNMPQRENARMEAYMSSHREA
jgi:hypothetical protein